MPEDDRLRCVFARVVRMSPCNMYGFARAEKCSEEIFFHLYQSRSLQHAMIGLTLILDEPRRPTMNVGDCIVARVVRTDQGLKAEAWGLDLYPRPWLYEDPLFRRCGHNPGGVTAAFLDFLDYIEAYPDYIEHLRCSTVDQLKLAYVANAYMLERVEDLVLRPSVECRRPWTATALIMLMTAFAGRYELRLLTAEMSGLVRKLAKPDMPRDPLERLIKSVFEALAADKPVLADRLFHEAAEREHVPVTAGEAAARMSKLGAFLSQALAPVRMALDTDPAIAFLAQHAARAAEAAPARYQADLRLLLGPNTTFREHKIQALLEHLQEQSPALAATVVSSVISELIKYHDKHQLEHLRPHLYGPLAVLAATVDNYLALACTRGWRELLVERLREYLEAGQVCQAIDLYEQTVPKRGGDGHFAACNEECARVQQVVLKHRLCRRLERESATALDSVGTNNLILLMERCDPAIRETLAWRKAMDRVARSVAFYPKLQTRLARLAEQTPCSSAS